MEEEQGERRRIVDDDIVVVFSKNLETGDTTTMPKNGDVCCEKGGGVEMEQNCTTAMEKNNN